MNQLLFIVGVVILSGAAGRTAGQAHPLVEEIKKRAQVIKPSLEELKWRGIPWFTDLAVGQRIARAEHRPILLWVTGDDPLERC